MRLKVGSRDAWIYTGVKPSMVPFVGPAAPPPPPTGGAPGVLRFNGSYSTGNFGQWPNVHNKFTTGSGSSYDALPPSYPATIVSDPTYTWCARFEARQGDHPSFDGTTVARTEVSTDEAQAGGHVQNSVVWYDMNIKFDPSFPVNAASLGWTVLAQWHQSPTQAPVLTWCPSMLNNNLSLKIDEQDSSFNFVRGYSIYDIPITRDVWINTRVQIKWSTAINGGYVRLWVNGTRVNFLPPPSGNATGGSVGVTGGSPDPQTFIVQTMTPGQSSVYYKEGIYRNNAIAPTYIIKHAGCKVYD